MDEQDSYARAKRQVEEIRGFYMHLAVYIAVNLLLFAINMVSSPGTLWFYWVTIFWGVGVFFHALQIFGRDRFLGREWEEKKIREVMEREERR